MKERCRHSEPACWSCRETDRFREGLRREADGGVLRARCAVCSARLPERFAVCFFREGSWRLIPSCELHVGTDWAAGQEMVRLPEGWDEWTVQQVLES